MSHRQRSSASSSPGLEPSSLREAARRLESLVQEFEVGQPIDPAAPARMGPGGCPSGSPAPDAWAGLFEEIEEECSHYDGMDPAPLPLEGDEHDEREEDEDYEHFEKPAIDVPSETLGTLMDDAWDAAIGADPAPIRGGEHLELMLDEELLSEIIVAGPSSTEVASAFQEPCVEESTGSAWAPLEHAGDGREAIEESPAPAEDGWETIGDLLSSSEDRFEPMDEPLRAADEPPQAGERPAWSVLEARLSALAAAGHGTFDNSWVYEAAAASATAAPSSPSPSVSTVSSSGPGAAAVLPSPANEVEPPPFLVEPPILAGSSESRSERSSARKLLGALGLGTTRR